MKPLLSLVQKNISAIHHLYLIRFLGHFNQSTHTSSLVEEKEKNMLLLKSRTQEVN